MIGKPKFTGILAYLVGFSFFVGCGEDSKTLTVQYTRGAYTLDLVAIVTIGPDSNSYSANISPVVATDGTNLTFYGHSVSSSGVVDDSAIAAIKRCAVYLSTSSGTPELAAEGFVSGTISSSACTDSGGAMAYFTRVFGDGKTYEVDPLSSGESNLIDADNGYVLALFFNNSRGAYKGAVSNPLRRCLQICGRKVQGKQFYSARSQSLSDVLNCDLSALTCYDF